MDFRLCLATVSLAVAAPLAAQPPGGGPGPWVADADGDSRITRDEMRAYMERRFDLMDQDGDGVVPAQIMQRLLGHDGRDGDRHGRGKLRKDHKPYGGAGEQGSPGGAGAPPPNGPPPGGHPPASDRAQGGPPFPSPGQAMPWPEDGNDDGQIDRAEFAAPALTLFDDQDRDGDGVLTVAELPPPGKGGPPPEE